MLQFPHIISGAHARRQFSKGEISEITRGSATTGARKKQPAKDPLVKLAQRLQLQYDSYTVSCEALLRLKAKFDPKIFEPSAVFLPAAFLLTIALSVNDRKFITEGDIDRWVSEHRTHYLKQARLNKKWSLKLMQKGVGIVTGKVARKNLMMIRDVERNMKVALRKCQRRQNRTWREIGYSAALKQKERWFWSYITTRDKIMRLKPTTEDGALALLSFLHRFAELEDRSFESTGTYGKLPAKYRAKILRAASDAILRITVEAKP